jgi:hypothetical protein
MPGSADIAHSLHMLFRRAGMLQATALAPIQDVWSTHCFTVYQIQGKPVIEGVGNPSLYYWLV